jgi:hypothetical protein
MVRNIKLRVILSDKKLFKVVTNIKVKNKNNATKRRKISVLKKKEEITPNEINYATILLNDTK